MQENLKDQCIAIGDRLKKLRWKTGLTMPEVAARAGVSVSHISKLEVGTGKPGRGALTMLANFYKVSVDYLIDGTTGNAETVVSAETSGTGHAVPGDMIDTIADIVCADGTMDKARVVSQTLGCSCRDALALVIRQALKK